MRPAYLAELQAWQTSARRKPLVLNGARQVGKTYLIQQFAEKAYRKYVYLNFEYDPTLHSLFQAQLDPHQIIAQLGLYHNTTIEPGHTLIILDEIQECPQALNSLKYFYEYANDYHVIAAGSLLGLLLRQSESFPVGKVNFMQMWPMSFLEFVRVTQGQQVYDFLHQINAQSFISDPLHETLIQSLKSYLIVGGMPESVATWLDQGDYRTVREVQHEILQAYQLDFAKHASPYEAMKIKRIWSSLPHQLARENKKFIFKAVRRSARSREYESALSWLDSAHLIHRAYHVTTPKQPLEGYGNDEAFKVYTLDVGLLGAQCHIDPKLILQHEALFQEYNGALTENFVAQMLRPHAGLYYWTSTRLAEVDFLLDRLDQIIPVEVKAAYDRKTKSLRVYESNYQPNRLMRLSLRNLKFDDTIENYPLYLAELLPRL